MKSDIVNSEKGIYKKDIGKNAIQNMRLYMKYMVFQGIVYDCCIRKQREKAQKIDFCMVYGILQENRKIGR